MRHLLVLFLKTHREPWYKFKLFNVHSLYLPEVPCACYYCAVKKPGVQAAILRAALAPRTAPSTPVRMQPLKGARRGSHSGSLCFYSNYAFFCGRGLGWDQFSLLGAYDLPAYHRTEIPRSRAAIVGAYQRYAMSSHADDTRL